MGALISILKGPGIRFSSWSFKFPWYPRSITAPSTMSTTVQQIDSASPAHFTSHEQLAKHKEAAESVSAAAQKERDLILSRMRGAKVNIPDLQCMMSHWPQGVNPEIEKLNLDSQDMLAW